MSAFQIEVFVQATDEKDAINFWDAPFKDIAFSVPSVETVMVDAQWTANLPGLAQEKLGSPFLWWAILMFNGLYDSIRDVQPGVQLRIPDRNRLMAFIQARQSENSGTNYLPNSNVTLL
jgi:hypothetical protein